MPFHAILFCILTFFFPFVFLYKTTLRAALHNSQIDILKGSILRYIEGNFTDVIIPKFDEDLFFFRIKANSNKVHVNKVLPEQLEFSLINNTNDFLMKATNLSTEGFSNVTIRLLFLTHNCELNIICRRASFVARIGVKQNKTRLEIAIKSMIYELDPKDIDIILKGYIIDNLLSTLVRMRKRFFITEMKRCMLRILPEIMTDIFNKILQDIPDDLHENSGLLIKLAISENPFIYENYMVGSVFTFIHSENEKTVPDYPISEMRKYDENCKKGAQIFVTSYLVRSAIETAQKLNLLKFNLTTNLLGMNWEIYCISIETPEFFIDEKTNKISGIASFNCDFIINNWLNFGIFAKAKGELFEYARNSTIYFQIAAATLLNLDFRLGFKFSLFLLLPLINFIGKIIGIPILNNSLGKIGIKMPELPYFNLLELDQNIRDGYIEVCTTLVPKFNEQNNDLCWY